MAITRGQAAGSGHGGAGGFGAQTVTLPGAVTAGQLLVCLWVGNSNTGNATCADNINGAWTALTQQSPFSGSGRRMNWFYKLNSAAASAGALTVTVTPVANAGNSEWMQVATYNGVSAYDSAVNAYSLWTGGSGAITQLSGTPTQSGDLILYGISSDAETTQAMTASGVMTSMVLDATSKSGGASPNFALGFDELLGAGASAVTASMTMSAGGDDGGRWVIGFSPSTAATITKTQTATARIANTRTKTQTAIARISNNKTKTQTAIARISNTRTKTQTAISRIANTRTKTQSANASIIKTVTKTQTATARIANSRTKTQSAIARISNLLTKTQTATARIGQTGTKTQTAKAAIVKTQTKTQTAIASVGVGKTKNQAATARISNRLTKTQRATACIVQNVYRFTPPVSQGPSRYTGRVRDRVWRHYRGQLTGITVLKTNGAYTQVETPMQSQISAADVAYLGGHTYEVTADEASALQAAGYDITLGVNL
jgi:hypothetical protein